MMTRAPLLASLALLTLGGCAEMMAASSTTATQAAASSATPTADVPPPPPPPPASANTAEELDTTTEEQRAAATAAPARPAEESARLGTTIASLGPPAEPGIWIKTPLVTSVTMGRAEAANGQSIAVELRPSGGAAGSGSQISLAAMRLLELPLTGLPELTLFRS